MDVSSGDAPGPPANIPDWSAPSAELLWTLRTHTHTSGSHQHPLAFAGGKRRLGWAARVWHRVCMCVRMCTPALPTLPAACRTDQEARGDLVPKCSNPGLLTDVCALWADSLCLPRRGPSRADENRSAAHRGWSACNWAAATALLGDDLARGHPQLWALGQGCGLWKETETNVDERKRGLSSPAGRVTAVKESRPSTACARGLGFQMTSHSSSSSSGWGAAACPLFWAPCEWLNVFVSRCRRQPGGPTAQSSSDEVTVTHAMFPGIFFQ